MKKAIIGRKLGMTQIFTSNGQVVPVTVVQAGPCPVIQKKTVETDGYSAVQLGFEDIRSKLVNKPLQGHFKKAGIPFKRFLREFRLDNADTYEVGAVVTVEAFEEGEQVDVTGISKGKGFQGVIKRWNQSRGRMTHGSDFHRKPGAMSAGTSPGRVFKTKRMPGRMGGETKTVQNLTVVRVDKERGVLLIKGSVPGAKGAVVAIRDSVKRN